MLVRIVYFGFLLGATFAKSYNPPSLNCGRQQCRDDGEVICGKLEDNYKLFTGSCAVLAHYCDTGEQYTIIPYDQCPPQAFNVPRSCPEQEDYVCATADNQTYRVFKNYCEYNNFLMVLRRVYWTVTLDHCIGLPDMPSGICSSLTATGGEVCAFDGTIYTLFPSVSALNQEKCFNNERWQRVSLIYC
ncbi:unnamed protein product [Hermetia illucens]|uniref:Uncharacterized protein n=1 Tax=Hermetia illucens TaxID=343691 RepID=A0A7R8UXP9_HERIL|nr:uncharacterized protein LOC119654462 [Hermetia illucens]CAD7089055.1 unnamed protein product [Hermetia illucens]